LCNDSENYIQQINEIVNLAKNKNSKFIFIAPWFSTSYDIISEIKHEDKLKLIKEYSLAIENYSKINNHIFINPNEYLEKIIINNTERYMVDFIHPNSNEGIELYSESVFANSKKNFIL
jgi:hypothetical protein